MYVLLQHLIKLLLLLVSLDCFHDRTRHDVEVSCLLHMDAFDVIDLGLEEIHALFDLDPALFLADVFAVGLEVLPGKVVELGAHRSDLHAETVVVRVVLFA